jgi:hypothetical protein
VRLPKRTNKNTRTLLEKVLKFILIPPIDKERYEKELRALETFSEKLKKPKKCLSAYMIFVKEVLPA